MRIIGGSLKGRRLQTPPSMDIRPTTDRVRETLFNILAHSYIDDFSDHHVLDLYAGTGALGLEALSRGAASALFVDNNVPASRLIQANIDHLGVTSQARLFRQDATRLRPRTQSPLFSLVFMDPPYQKNLVPQTLDGLHKGGWLAAEALLVIEEHADQPLSFASPYERLDHRTFGITQMSFVRYGLAPGLAAVDERST